MLVVCASDSNYITGLAVMLFSVLKNIRDVPELAIYVFDLGISPKDKERLKEVVKKDDMRIDLKFITPNLKNRDLPSLRYGMGAYCRLLIPDIVDSKFNKAIYLDIDLLIRTNLKKLWEIDIGNNALLAVRDYSAETVSARAVPAYYRKLNLPANSPYLNSGVLVFNLNRWRSENLGNKILDHCVQYKDRLVYPDQDGINAILCEDWKELDLKWNVPVYIFRKSLFNKIEGSEFKETIRIQKKELAKNAYIYHFIGSRKPWQSSCGLLGQLEWINYLESSNFYSKRETLTMLKYSWLLRFDWLVRNTFRRAKDIIGKI